MDYCCKAGGGVGLANPTHPRFSPPPACTTATPQGKSQSLGRDHAIVAKVTPAQLRHLIASIGATEEHLHHDLLIIKATAITELRHGLGIPTRSPHSGTFPKMAPCEACSTPVPSRRHLKNNSKRELGAIPPLHQILTACYDQYTNQISGRISRDRDNLVTSTLTDIKKNFLEKGAYICWSCASDTLIHSLQS